MSRRRVRNRAVWLFLLPHLPGVLCFSLLPFVEAVKRSFLNALGNRFTGLANYKAVIENAAFRRAAWNTLRFSLVCIPLLVGGSLLLAMLVGHLKAGKQLLKNLFLLPMAVPAASVVLVWKVLFHGKGLLNGLLEILGLKGVPWMTSGAAFWVLVISYLWKNLGYDLILWLAGLSAISPEIYEAARVDGAGSLQCFRRITLPNLKGSFYTITILSFLNSFKVFREAWLVAGNYPDESMYLLQHLYNNWFRDLSFERIAAAGVLHALVVAALVWLLRRGSESRE